MISGLYTKFIAKWSEVTELPPQTVGPLTPLYKRAVPYFKIDPWRVIIPVALVFITVTVIILRGTAAEITSVLQLGF